MQKNVKISRPGKKSRMPHLIKSLFWNRLTLLVQVLIMRQKERSVELPLQRLYHQQKKRGRTNLLTPHVLSSLDRAKISNRHAVQLIGPIIHAYGVNLEEYCINRSSIRRYRMLNRTTRAADLKAEFRSHEPLVLHWDGKLIGDLTSDEKVDRFPIIVSGSATEQLLCIPKLSSETGQAMADANSHRFGH